MFKKTITFTDFNGKTQTKDFYFHISKAELLLLAAEGQELLDRLQRMVDTKDMKAIYQEYTEIIRMGCGIRSEDGAQFIKTPEAQSALMNSPALDELIMELALAPDAGAAFIQQLFPPDVIKEIVDVAEKKAQNATVAELPEDNRPAWLKENRTPTQAELIDMTAEELRLAFQQSGK